MYLYWVVKASIYLADLLLYKSQVGWKNVRASNFHVGFAYKLQVGFAYKTQVGCKNVIFTFDSILQFHFRRVTDFAGFLQKESLKKPRWISVTRTTFSSGPCRVLIG